METEQVIGKGKVQTRHGSGSLSARVVISFLIGSSFGDWSLDSLRIVIDTAFLRSVGLEHFDMGGWLLFSIYFWHF